MKRIFMLLFISSVVLQSCYKESYIPVEANFRTEFKNADESIPVYIVLDNLSKGADTYLWEFEGGSPLTSDKKEPSDILYTVPGSYTIKLTVSNVDGEKDVYEQKIDIKDAINIVFTKEIIQSDYPPVEVKFTNSTQGQDLTYDWTFEGGTPGFYDDKNPPNVLFREPGSHLVKLIVSNGFETFQRTDTVHVKENIITDFEWETAYEDYDYQAPVKLFMKNLSQHTISYQWSFPGGSPASSTQENPEVIYSQAGTYTITLNASNGKSEQTLQKQITVHPDTGIYILENIKLGINYAHNTGSIGAFYSTKLRRSFLTNEITPAVAVDIDIAFQGQDNTFTYNKFISPTEVSQYGFAGLINAKQTLFINSQEICNCGLNFTVGQFEAMVNDTPLQNLNIPHSIAGQQQFGPQLPRVILFKTQDGRKGAINIKEFVVGTLNQSYILCDIKVQK